MSIHKSTLPDQLGKYKIIAEIGRGGFGTVYRAQDTLMDSPVALKVLAPHLLYDPEFVERFKREAQLARSLKHPNIVIVYDLFVEQGMNFLVMELIEGASLNKIIHPNAPLAFDQVIRIATQVADALDYAHSRGVLHRDIKPSNILIGAEDHVTLTDFGLAKAASNSALTSQAMLGTPSYVSPEQAEGGMASASSDLYSLGVVVYEMLTGTVPFKGETPLSVLRQIADKPVLPPSQWRRNLPAEVDAVLLKALSKQPSERFTSGKEFTRALVEALDADKRKQLKAEARAKRDQAEHERKGQSAVSERIEETQKTADAPVEPAESGRKYFLLSTIGIVAIIFIFTICAYISMPLLLGSQISEIFQKVVNGLSAGGSPTR